MEPDTSSIGDIVCVVDCGSPLPIGGLLAIAFVVLIAFIATRWWTGLIAAAVAALTWLFFDRVYQSARYGADDPAFVFDAAFVSGAIIAYAVCLGLFSMVFGLRRLLARIAPAWSGIARVLGILVGVSIFGTTALLVFASTPEILPMQIVETVREVSEQASTDCSAGTVAPVGVVKDSAPIDDFRATDRQTTSTGVVQTPLPAFAKDLPVARNYWSATSTGRLLTARGVIRRSDALSGHSHVDVSVVVGPQGEVLAAEATGGSHETHRSAIDIARGWRFGPYILDGKRVPARVEKLSIPVTGPEIRVSPSNPLPELRDGRSLRIRLVVRTLGTNSDSYVLTIRGDGSVLYNGKSYVALLGAHCALVDKGKIETLITAFRRADFASLKRRYVSAQTDDLFSTELSVSFDGHAVSVYEAGGIAAGMPDVVEHLQRMVRHAAGADRWTGGNVLTGPSLIAERWNFKRSDDANTTMLVGVAQYGDYFAMRDLIALNAPMLPQGIIAPQGWALMTPLGEAARRDEIQMVRALLATPTHWMKSSLTRALLEMARNRVPDLVAHLIKRGADADGRDDFDGETPLMRSRDAETTRILLEAGADPRVRDERGRTALDHARSRDGGADVAAVLQRWMAAHPPRSAGK